MLLNELFKDAPSVEIEQLSIDSRLKMKNAIFFCLDGIKYDGHNYIKEAIDNGAIVIVHSKELKVKYKAIYIKVGNVSNTLVKIADRFYNHPNENMDNYVVCGNYGRCSVSSFIYNYLNRISNCGYVGILGIRYQGYELKTNFPTQNILDNVILLDTMKRAGISSCTFEVSASALNLQKLDSVKPDCFIYTCTNRNSSEFQTNDYFTYIRRYLYTFDNDTKVVLNIDDVSFDELHDCIENYVTYGTSTIADYQIRDVQISRSGINFKIIHDEKTYNIKSGVQGIVNVYNLTAAICALHQMGYDLDNIIEQMIDIPYVDGVMERVDEDYNIIIDCAYDINSIEEVCKYASFVKQKNKAIGVISINYSDGDRRLSKIMEICDKYLDVIILTENESLDFEVMEILERCNRYSVNKRLVHIPKRSTAIENAIEIMNANDTLIIIGKGNERFLSMGLGKEYYNGDKYYAVKYIGNRKKEENEII